MSLSNSGIDDERGTAFGRYWGATEQVSCLHFEACYYQPLAWCIAQGYQRFEGGAQGEHKMARGLLPVQTCWPGDAGPLITWGLVVTRGPQGGPNARTRQNLGIYRQQVIGPRQTIAVSSDTRKPMDMTCMPQASRGISFFSSPKPGSPSTPSIRGAEGP